MFLTKTIHFLRFFFLFFCFFAVFESNGDEVAQNFSGNSVAKSTQQQGYQYNKAALYSFVVCCFSKAWPCRDRFQTHADTQFSQRTLAPRPEDGGPEDGGPGASAVPEFALHHPARPLLQCATFHDCWFNAIKWQCAFLCPACLPSWLQSQPLQRICAAICSSGAAAELADCVSLETSSLTYSQPAAGTSCRALFQ